ncbi:MAG TPA: hypothetical protein PK691_05860, partial [Thermomicrobiales bacterium]|nr:hypothetical protein [Thermomicrobiales bacterium]
MTPQTRNDQAMLRGPRSVPAITRLGGGAISTIGENQPYRAIGNDAIVYQLRQPAGKVIALRAWLSETIPAETLERYRALTKPETLRHLQAVANSPIINNLKLFSDGLLLEGEDLHSQPRPLVTMDWIMGPTILAAVDRACKANDTGYLTALAGSWRRAVLAAAEGGFVHGDLTPDNAILRPKEGVAFVDYDTAYWPGAPTAPDLKPSPAYAHAHHHVVAPEDGDNFSAYLIYVSLRVLATWTALRAEHGQPATVKGAALLFQPRDLANPDGSPLFGKLRVIDDPVIRGLVGMLREFCLGDIGDMPGIVESLELANRLAEKQEQELPVLPRNRRMGSILSSAASMVRNTATRGTDRLRPPQPAQPIFEPERTAWEGQATLFQPDRLALLGKAIHRGDLTQAEAEWVRVKAEPGAGALSPALEQLRQRVDGRVEPTDIGRQMRYSELSRAEVRRRLANALDVDDRNALRDLALAGDLDDMVELSEEATHRIVATLAISHLEHAIEIDDDILIMQAWDQSLFADGAVISETQRLRVDLAIERRAWLGQVRVALRKRDVDHIDDLMQMMPTTADSRLTDRERLRIQRMRDQRQAIADLRRAVFREQDGEVVQALHTVERLGAPIPEDMPWQEITSVVNRYALLAAIRKVVGNPPLDLVRLATLLPQLK